MPSNHFSGAESIVCQIMEMFKDDPIFEMLLVCGNGPIGKQLEKKGINYKTLEKFNRRNVKKIVKEWNADIIHAHDFRASVIASEIDDVKVISHLHSNPLWLNKLNLRSLIYLVSLSHISVVLGVSKSICDEYIFSTIMKHKFKLLSNTVNSKIIQKEKSSFNIKDGIDMLYVGRLEEPKNPLEFIKIVKGISIDYPEVKAVMVGNGILKQKCEAYISRNDLTNNVVMVGFKDNPYPYMNKAEILVIPSLYEGFGLVAIESLIIGTPVLCSGVGGLSDIVDNKTVFRCNDVKDYVELSLDLLKTNYKKLHRQEMIDLAKKYTDVDKYKTKLKKIYLEILKDE